MIKSELLVIINVPIIIMIQQHNALVKLSESDFPSCSDHVIFP